ncbi:hypothetical protein IAR50_000552 [Cryptococcus sp. DSM 104548]
MAEANNNTTSPTTNASTTRTLTSDMVPTIPESQQSRWNASGVEEKTQALQVSRNSTQHPGCVNRPKAAENPRVYDDK